MNASVTSVVLESGEGALFPASGSFHISIGSEILICTSRSSDTLTVSRAAESTSAAIHTAGVSVALNIISKHISDLNTAVNAIETVLASSGGLSGSLGDETGSGALVFATSPTLVTPALGTPAPGVLTNTTGYTGDTALVTTGVLNSGSINTSFGTINNNAAITGTTVTGSTALVGGTIAGTSGTFSGIVDITLATDATDATGDTGALRTEGGASIAKKLYVGSDLNVTGNATITGTTTLNGALVLGDAAADILTVNATIQGATPLVFEGGSAGDFETSFAIADPSADRTITFPDLTGTVALTGVAQAWSTTGTVATGALTPSSIAYTGNLYFTGTLTTASNTNNYMVRFNEADSSVVASANNSGTGASGYGFVTIDGEAIAGAYTFAESSSLMITGPPTQGASMTLTKAFALNVVAGNVSMAATAKLFLDGGNDTYIHEQSANVMQFFTADTHALQINASQDIWIPNGSVLMAAT